MSDTVIEVRESEYSAARTFSPKNLREPYNSLRVKYQKLAQHAEASFFDGFTTIFPNMDVVHESCESVVLEALDRVIEEALSDLVHRRILDVDQERFMEEYLDPYLTWPEDFRIIDDQYLEIVLKADELDAHRTQRRQQRGRVVGGGFGIGGTIKGATGAAAANAAFGLAHGLFNLGAKAVSAAADHYKKNKLYESEENRRHLSMSMGKLLFSVHYALVDAIEASRPGEISGRVSGPDADKARRLVDNVAKSRISDPSDVRCALSDAIELNPYDSSAYILYLDHFGDKDQSLEQAARHFSVLTIRAAKRDRISVCTSGFDLTTIHGCTAALAALRTLASRLGYDCSEEVQDIEKKLNEIREKAKLAEQRKPKDLQPEVGPATAKSTPPQPTGAPEPHPETPSDTAPLRPSRRSVADAKLKASDEKTRATEQSKEYQRGANLEDVLRHKLIVPTPDPQQSSKSVQTPPASRSIGWKFGLGILILPLPFALLTLRAGYSTWARSISILWMLIFIRGMSN
jgi:hypothetical protein